MLISMDFAPHHQVLHYCLQLEADPGHRDRLPLLPGHVAGLHPGRGSPRKVIDAPTYTSPIVRRRPSSKDHRLLMGAAALCTDAPSSPPHCHPGTSSLPRGLPGPVERLSTTSSWTLSCLKEERREGRARSLALPGRLVSIPSHSLPLLIIRQLNGICMLRPVWMPVWMPDEIAWCTCFSLMGLLFV